RASHALQGEDDDIRYPEDDEPSYAGINGTQYRWPGYPGGGKVPYVLDPDVQKDKSDTFFENKKYVTATSDKYHKCPLNVKRSALTTPGFVFLARIHELPKHQISYRSICNILAFNQTLTKSNR
ncbi:hypothetical protein AVEN_258586-1, partial [Araneus ventricosus]